MSLRSMGAKVESCPTYEEGLSLAKKIPFDVAVVDQSLPDGIGLHLLQELYAVRPSMGLLMYTVRDDPGPVSYTHLRAHETVLDLVCRLLLEQKHDIILSLSHHSIWRQPH